MPTSKFCVSIPPSQISALNEEKRQWGDQAAALEQRCAAAETESRRLREENERLKAELGRISGVDEGSLAAKRLKPS